MGNSCSQSAKENLEREKGRGSQPQQLQVVCSFAAKATVRSGGSCRLITKEGLLLVAIMPHGTTINSDGYVATLKKLQVRLSRFRRHREKQDVLLLHDNAQPYDAKIRSENSPVLEFSGTLKISKPKLESLDYIFSLSRSTSTLIAYWVAIDAMILLLLPLSPFGKMYICVCFPILPHSTLNSNVVISTHLYLSLPAASQQPLVNLLYRVPSLEACLSSTLFKIYLEGLVKKSFQNMGWVIVGGRRIKCTRFADNMALLAEEKTVLRDMLLELNARRVELSRLRRCGYKLRTRRNDSSFQLISQPVSEKARASKPVLCTGVRLECASATASASEGLSSSEVDRSWRDLSSSAVDRSWRDPSSSTVNCL
ncbi:hypothetical protein ANN_18157 [Periplaneta americana]|uniref:Mariner Mos1 transposase n=1 Tax=Periplaneta americana TaxID=6978 RepID=A0ABQ8SP49_PERAM|nr:hypothetical protein ANN_18157 [Periplaneta americana]